MRANPLTGIKRIWLGDDGGVNSVRLFRRRFDIPAGPGLQKAELTIFAESHYHIWLNGVYLGRGPTFYHPHRRPAETYDLLPRLHAGPNVIAVLAQYEGVSLHNHIPAGTPGLAGRIDLTDQSGNAQFIVTDCSWKAAEQTGWQADMPRRTWCISFVEHFDAATAPVGWQEIDFDDSAWRPAEEHSAFPENSTGTYFRSELPRLCFAFKPVVSLLGVYTTTAAVHPLSFGDPTAAFAAALMNETWENPKGIQLACIHNPALGTLQVSGLCASKGAVLCLDMGRQYVGAVSFQMTADSPGVVDIGWSEVLRDNRPQILRKGGSYADRYTARAGTNTWLPISFSSGRYLTLILRGFNGQITFQRLGMLASEPALDWSGSFSCDNSRLNAIWELCARTVRIGVQEGLMDCPTREQATYIGDANPHALWIGRLTGNYAFWKHLVNETFAVQADDGQLKSTPFSGMKHTLLDYTLLAVVFANDYLKETGDRETIRNILPACRKLIRWFYERLNAVGLFDLPWENMNKRADFVQAPASSEDSVRDIGYNIFIDHPGLGWHNRNDPGIDRRGLNAAMNALLTIAERALADMLEAVGETGHDLLRHQADRRAAIIGETFWNNAENAFADGRLNGKLLPQLSQQTNTWCLAAKCPGSAPALDILRRILKSDDMQLARNGPYFWSYLLPVMADHGLLSEALGEIERLWSGMLAGGATCCWETFSGDELDSWCHPWSAAPVDFMPRRVAGIGCLPPGQKTIALKPQISLLRQVSAKVFTAAGPVSLDWTWDGPVCHLKGALPTGITGLLQVSDKDGHHVTGDWQQEF